jgi:glycosyltransferase involved in cell wall biosynthesis
MTAWNAEATVERALESVLAERSVPLECVFIDDGSTDATARLVEAIAARDPRVVVARAPRNEGVVAERNRALTMARGEWIAFVDADDRVPPQGLAALWGPTQTSDPLMVIGQRVWTNGRRTWITPNYDHPDVRTPGRKSLVRNPGLFHYVSATGRLIHRSLITDLRFVGRHLADHAWTIRAMLRAGDRIQVIDDVVYEWFRPVGGQGGDSVTARTRGQARIAAEAIAVVTDGVLAVIAEAEGLLDDPRTRRLIAHAYVDRLVRGDLPMYLGLALARRDPDLPELLLALEHFVRDLPAEVIAGQGAVARALLAPPVRRWSRLSPRDRAAYWSLLQAARRADQKVLGKVRRRSMRWTLRVAARLPTPLADLALRLRGRLAALRRRGRKRRGARHVTEVSGDPG